MGGGTYYLITSHIGASYLLPITCYHSQQLPVTSHIGTILRNYLYLSPRHERGEWNCDAELHNNLNFRLRDRERGEHAAAEGGRSHSGAKPTRLLFCDGCFFATI